MKTKLLLVDEGEGVRKALGISLQEMGYRVYTAENSEAALELFTRTDIPVVLIDIKMPGMDGVELLRRLKRENPDTEVIMIADHADLDLVMRSLKFEAADFITKPADNDILRVALKRAGERISRRLQLKAYMENLERQVEEKSRELSRAGKMAAIGETVAELSHTIKNIASGLKGGIFVLEKGMELADTGYQRQGWEMVKGNVDKITNLSLDLLNYAKSTDIKCHMCNPNVPAAEVAKLMTPLAVRHGINLKMELADNLAELTLDPEGIHLCLMNLVKNALDACLEDEDCESPKTIILGTARALNGGVEYHVTDNCLGMDKEITGRIFQCFFSTKGTKGTGIGLMLTKKIVDAHRGSISVQSERGKGSRFTIKLPGIIND
ncbi:Response regulator receiver protein [Syntrophobacter sp. SbD1]|nr:Response regulator receiver protein [Syntrophobacter sp. SbD1]